MDGTTGGGAPAPGMTQPWRYRPIGAASPMGVPIGAPVGDPLGNMGVLPGGPASYSGGGR